MSAMYEHYNNSNLSAYNIMYASTSVRAIHMIYIFIIMLRVEPQGGIATDHVITCPVVLATIIAALQPCDART